MKRSAFNILLGLFFCMIGVGISSVNAAPAGDLWEQAISRASDQRYSTLFTA